MTQNRERILKRMDLLNKRMETINKELEELRKELDETDNLCRTCGGEKTVMDAFGWYLECPKCYWGREG